MLVLTAIGTSSFAARTFAATPIPTREGSVRLTQGTRTLVARGTVVK